MIKYILYKSYEERMGKGKWPKVTKMYLIELPPIAELSKDRLEAVVLNKSEADEISYLLSMEMERI